MRSTTTTRVADTSSGSRTIVVAQDEVQSGEEDHSQVVGNIRLRGARPRSTQRVVWDEDVVDNEGCGKKSSKICCIYNKPRAFDESSSEEDSSDEGSDSDASSCSGHGGAGHRHAKKKPKKVPKDAGEHEPNAYEKQPSNKGKGRA